MVLAGSETLFSSDLNLRMGTRGSNQRKNSATQMRLPTQKFIEPKFDPSHDSRSRFTFQAEVLVGTFADPHITTFRR